MKIFKRIVITIVVLLVIIAGLGFSFYKANQNALKSVHSSKTTVSKRIEQGKPFSILLLGADTGTDGRVDRGNSDTIMMITVNPKTNKVLMYSVHATPWLKWSVKNQRTFKRSIRHMLLALIKQPKNLSVNY
ncbi:hypothetical protein [Companilactobacillus versmoldensis]|uniref:hypothetical protein n=1 Tax=Companilactobacillus versmoldensis TaxID=194326 RepID=UPI001F1D33A1|nr:hypothetical protein [Companilactobacillus versmoldensis]